MENPQIIVAQSSIEFQSGKLLFQAYAQSLDFDLGFQGFQRELEDIEQIYSAPNGTLLLVAWKKQFVGCVGVRTIEPSIGELKRMYLDSSLRGKGLGRQLMVEAIEVTKHLGLKKLRLDTLPKMQSALKLYKEFGFIEIEAYRHNPFEEAIFLELTL